MKSPSREASRRNRVLPVAAFAAAFVAGFVAACGDPGGGAPAPVLSGGAPSGATSGAPSGASSSPGSPPTASPPAASRDEWLRVTKGGRELGVVEMLSGKPWSVVLHSSHEDALALEKLVIDHGAKPLSISMHLPAEKKGERGPYGARLVEPGDALYPMAVKDRLQSQGFTADGSLQIFQDPTPPASVSKLEVSRDGAKVGTIDLAATPPKLDLVDRQGNALFLESFWKSLESEDPLVVSYLSTSGPSPTRVTVSAKKGTPEYAKLVRVAFMVRYAVAQLVVVP